MTPEKQIHQNDVKLKEALTKIQLLEKAVAKLVKKENERQVINNCFREKKCNSSDDGWGGGY